MENPYYGILILFSVYTQFENLKMLSHPEIRGVKVKYTENKFITHK